LQGVELEDTYTVEKELGQGCYGAVSLVKHKSNGVAYAMKHLALKSIKGSFMINLYLALREIELMKKLDHPHVIKLYEVFRGDEDLCVFSFIFYLHVLGRRSIIINIPYFSI
jgi:calcium-dependent protein kinase